MERKRRRLGITLAAAILIAALLWLSGSRLAGTEAAGTEADETTAGEAPAEEQTETEALHGAEPRTVTISLFDVARVSSRASSQKAVRTSAEQATHEMQEAMNEHEGLRYDVLQLDDIPVLEVYEDNGEEKPLLIFLHGLGLGKDSLLSVLSAYAEAGYYAVSMDAYNQGDRYSPLINCDSWAAMLITVSDVDRLIEYYETVPQADAAGFVLGGFSMGSVEAWAYAEIGGHSPAALVTLSGMCEYSVWQERPRKELAYAWLRPWKDSVWSFPEWQDMFYTREKISSIIHLNVTQNLDSFRELPVFICIGTDDVFFDADAAGSVADTIADSGNESVSFIKYDGVAHEITDQMIADSIHFLEAL